jgi:hypothetical protein
MRKNYYKRKKTNPFIFKHQKLSVSAKQRGIEYDLDPEFLKGIWTGICPIAKEEIFISTSMEDRIKPRAAELDRFVPELGYTKGNVTWISREYNMKKLNSSIEDMEKMLDFMKNHVPIKEATSDILKPKQVAWNKGIKLPEGYGKKGKDNPMARLCAEQVLEIRNQWKGTRGQITEFSKKYKVSPATIRKIVNRITWKHLQTQEK